ncbi:unnamed protein product, partial [Ectocarpus sp. 12 AP-2014]
EERRSSVYVPQGQTRKPDNLFEGNNPPKSAEPWSCQPERLTPAGRSTMPCRRFDGVPAPRRRSLTLVSINMHPAVPRPSGAIGSHGDSGRLAGAYSPFPYPPKRKHDDQLQLVFVKRFVWAGENP